MSELSEYLRAALASGRTRETITQELIEQNWKPDDIAGGFDELSPVESQPRTVVPSSTSHHFTFPLIISAVVVSAGIIVSGIIWMNSRTSPAGAAPAPLVDEQGAPTAPPIIGTTIVETSVTTQSANRSETDVYGTDLYALAEGQTVKTLADQTKISYTRTGDKIAVKIVKITANSRESLDGIFMLNARQNYDRGLAMVKARIQESCPDAAAPDCALQLQQVKDQEASCANARTDKEVNSCMGSYTAKGYVRGAGGLMWSIFGF